MRKEQPGAQIKSLQRIHLTPYEIAKFASQLEATAFGEFLHELGIMFSHWGDNQHSFLTEAIAHAVKIPETEDRSQFLSGEDYPFGIELCEKLREAVTWVEMFGMFETPKDDQVTEHVSAYNNAKWAVKK